MEKRKPKLTALTIHELAEAYIGVCGERCLGDRPGDGCRFYILRDEGKDGLRLPGGCRVKNYLAQHNKIRRRWESPGDRQLISRIMEAMEKRGMSREELSFQADISLERLDWLFIHPEDSRSISLPMLSKFSKALNVPVSWLTGTGTAQEPDWTEGGGQ